MSERITREQARHVSEAAHHKADELGVSVSIAICDPAGRTVFVERGDDTGFLTPDTALAKARAAAAFGKSTKELVELSGNNPAFWQAMPSAYQEPVIPSSGATPIVLRNQTIGAIGCAGGSGDQAHNIALAGAFAIKPGQRGRT
jgi:uncharacterized protein GlcG (DUF336 family)